MHRVLLLGAVLALVGGLAACENMRRAFPLTTAGYEQGGVVGAFQGATSGLILVCQRLDGEHVRVALDMSAAAWGATKELERIREIRRAGCATTAAAHIVVGGVMVPATRVQTAPEPTNYPAS